MSISIGIILDTRREKKTKQYPVKLRVRSDDKVELYPTIYDLSKEDHKKFSAPRISEELQKIRNRLQETERDANHFAKEMDKFSFEEFEKDFICDNPVFRQKRIKSEPFVVTGYVFDIKPFEKRIKLLKEVHPGKDYISVTFLSYIKRLLEEGRIGSALNYQDSYNSLKRFRGNVRFTDINTSYLNQYEQWMINVRKCSITTVGIKLRSLRAVFNEAIENGIIKKEKCYPFGRRRYLLPTSRSIKKALDLSDVQKIYEHIPDCEEEKKARDFWLFFYFANGINQKDFAHLKYKNIDGEYLHFVRAKTERTGRGDPKIITAYINEDMQRIIDTWGNKDKNPDNFIFPIIKDEDDPMRRFNLVKDLVLFINKRMGVIASRLEIKRKVTNIVSRHTFSTVLKRSGASTEFIQESLGHTDKKTTENYLGSFEKEVKKEYASRLTAFKKQESSQVGV
ncbi:MAG: site-specific integrase [Bacteroidota bacterium]